jgi:hypothetical protein
MIELFSTVSHPVFRGGLVTEILPSGNLFVLFDDGEERVISKHFAHLLTVTGQGEKPTKRKRTKKQVEEPDEVEGEEQDVPELATAIEPIAGIDDESVTLVETTDDAGKILLMEKADLDALEAGADAEELGLVGEEQL